MNKKVIVHLRWMNSIGGVETYIHNLSVYTKFNETQHRHMIILLGNHLDNIDYKLWNLSDLIQIHGLSGYSINARLELIDQIKKINPILIVDHGLPPLFRPLIKYLFKVKYIIYDYGTFQLVDSGLLGLKRKLYEFDFKRCADFILTNSLYSKNKIKSYLGGGVQVEIIRMGVCFDDVPKPKDIPNRHRKKIGYLGRISYGDKGTDFLIQIAQRLKAMNSLLTIDVGGDGQDMDRFISQIRSLDLESYFKIHGQIRDKWSFLDGIKVMVLPSRTETFGLSALEAIFSGLKVIGFNIGALEESFGRYSSIELIEPFDVSKMTVSLIKACEEDDIASSQLELIRNQIEIEYSMRNYIINIESYAQDRIYNANKS